MWVPFALSFVWDVIIVGVGFCAYVQMRFPQWIGRTLVFCGKHSFNIFLFHTFFLLYFYQYVYWNRNPFLIFLTMTLTCLVVSVSIEIIKKLFSINKLQEFLIGKQNY